MKNELIGYMNNGSVCATIKQIDRSVNVDYSDGKSRIFENAKDAVRFLKNEGYVSFCNFLELVYLR